MAGRPRAPTHRAEEAATARWIAFLGESGASYPGISEYNTTAGSGIFDITTGPDGNLWVTATRAASFSSYISEVGKVTTGGSIT